MHEPTTKEDQIDELNIIRISMIIIGFAAYIALSIFMTQNSGAGPFNLELLVWPIGFVVSSILSIVYWAITVSLKEKQINQNAKIIRAILFAPLIGFPVIIWIIYILSL